MLDRDYVIYSKPGSFSSAALAEVVQFSGRVLMASNKTTSAQFEAAPATARPRLNSIDLLRGLVIVLMALDHTRDFFGASAQNPRDITQPALFLTRWITHFCAPTFVLLAGVSAYLFAAHGRSTREVSRFLLTRGLWLILIEFTLVGFGWNLSFASDLFIAGVIWVIGASMIILAGLVYLPLWAITAIGLAMIFGHNLLDGIHAEALGSASWIWNLLHQPERLEFSPHFKLLVVYPLLPWPGVMALGYVLGSLFKGGPGLLDKRAAAFRRLSLLWTGAALLAGFIVLRAVNLYGDPVGWEPQGTWLGTLLSFINCEKYPPSLLYLMMTLGPAMILLALFERADGTVVRWVTTYGRVPFLFYVVHLPLIHALAVVLAWFTTADVGWMFGAFVPDKPEGFGLSLGGIYAVWLSVLLLLYPLCRWFAGLKARRRDWWLSYL